MSQSCSLDVQVTSTTTVFPRIRKEDPTSTPLSIFDNASANFTRCAAVWFYPPPQDASCTLTSAHLKSSLSQTLTYYPQWCGRLSYATPGAKTRHNGGFQRIWLTYNTPSDIGVTFLTATSPKLLGDFLPNTSLRASTMKAWDGHQLPSSQLLPTTKLAISSDSEAPNVRIQVTTFACGSTAIAIEITHCLADAVAMSNFANDWARTSRALLEGQAPPALKPMFDPQVLDSRANGDIDSESPDSVIQQKARGLPQHRFDWYKSADGTFKLPEGLELEATAALSPSDPIPWHQWDVKAPVWLRVLHFSASEIEALCSLASHTKSTIKVSKHDALLAHIWTRINASRQLTPGTTTYLDMTFGLRPRVSPPLPDSFLGSPITHAAIPSLIPSSSYQVKDTQDLSTLAQTIRSTLARFTPDAIADILHDKAFEVAPQRLWAACLGREHVLLTTWIHSGVYDVNFTGRETGRPCYVEALMPDCDGLVEIMEAPGVERYKEGGKWWDDGVDVSVYLESEAMLRLLADENLFLPSK